MKILELGCGKNKYKSENPEDVVIGLDIFKLPDVDIFNDLEKTPLPFKDNEFDMVISRHVLEHIQNIIPLIEEIHRILKPNGIFKTTVPHFSNPSSHHFTHKTYWSYYSFDCFTEDDEQNYYSKARFKILSINFRLFRPCLNWLADRFPRFYEAWVSGLIRTAEITYALKAIK